MAKTKEISISVNNWYAIYDPNKGFTQFGIAQSLVKDVVLFKMKNGNMERYEHKYCTKVYENNLLSQLNETL
jgi:hypothetical protein